MECRLKNRLFVFLFLVVLSPLLQQNLQLITSGKLLGYFTNAQDAMFSFPKWFDGSYQPAKNDFINDHIGFRPDFIRLNNQVEFSLFNRTHGGSRLGKDHCLFFSNYIDAFNGSDFIGNSKISEKMAKLKAIQDTLARSGIPFLLVYAPSKAFYFQEYIPDNLRAKKGPTNYQAFLHIGDSLGIHQVDLNAWFLSMKMKGKDSLFTKQGIHWTVYASFIAGDSLIRYIEREKRIHMSHPVWTDVTHTSIPRATDNDIAGDENLIFPVSDEVFSYPEVHYTYDSSARKPDVIFIGDSFIMNMVKSAMFDNVFDNWQYWFCCRLLCNRNNYEGFGSNPKFKDYDWKPELNKTGCIIMLYTSIGLPDLGNGFIEHAYDYYYPSDK